MSFRWVLLIGFTTGFLHLVVRQWVEGFIFLRPENAYIDDVTVYVRPTINLLYNLRFGQPLTKEELQNLPENIRNILLNYYESSGRCLPNQGIYFGNAFFLIPIIVFVDLLNLSPQKFAFLTYVLPAAFCLVLYPLLHLFIAWIIGKSLSEKKALYLLFFAALLIPPFTNHPEQSNVFALGSVVFFLAYLRYRLLRLVFWSLLLAVIAYFMKFRNAPLIFVIPLTLFILKDPNRFRALGLMLLTWLPVQVLWSWHVYRYTCRWALTDPSSIFAATPCKGIDEYCFSKRELYNHFRVYLIRLEAKIGIPHSNYYHPDALLFYMKGYTYQGKVSDPFPRFFQKDTSLYARYMQLFFFAYNELASIKDEKMIILYGYYFVAQAKLLMLETDKKYFWLPLYRVFRVLRDNIFHPPVAGLSGEHRGRYPKWIRDSYFIYTSAYIAVSYLIGFLASLVILWMWLKGKLRDGGSSYATALVVIGWSLVAVAALTGNSEWRYFFLSAPLLLMAGVLVAARALQSRALSLK